MASAKTDALSPQRSRVLEPEPENEPECKIEGKQVASLRWLPTCFICGSGGRGISCLPDSLWRQSPKKSSPRKVADDDLVASKLDETPVHAEPDQEKEIAPKSFRPLVTLDLDFVRCSVIRNPDEQEEPQAVSASFAYDIQMEFIGDWSLLGTSTSSEGLAALLDFLDIVLRTGDFAHGFVLSFDFRGLYQPKLDVIVAMRDWAEDPIRLALWSERCRFWKVAVAGEASFLLTYNALFCLFAHDAPPSDTYLVTDINEKLPTKGAYCFRKNDKLGASIPVWGYANEFADSQGIWQFAENPTFFALPMVSMVSTLGDQFLSMFHEPKAASRRPLPGVGVTVVPKKVNVANVRGSSADGAKAMVEGSYDDYPQCSQIETTAATVTQRLDAETGLGELLLELTDAQVTEEALQAIMDFMDEFTSSSNVANGFCIIYDLRDMRIPSMTMVMKLAEWGNEPSRKESWERLNKACKIIMNPGLKFSICIGILTSLFYACPPVCRTTLMTSLDDEDAVVFEPPPKPDVEGNKETDVTTEEKLAVNGVTEEREEPDADPPLASEKHKVRERETTTECPVTKQQRREQTETADAKGDAERGERSERSLRVSPARSTSDESSEDDPSQFMSLQHFSMDYGIGLRI